MEISENDWIDSFKIASLIYDSSFPLAYVYPKAMPATCDFLHQRMKIVRHATVLKVHAVITASQYNQPSVYRPQKIANHGPPLGTSLQ